MYTFFFTYYSYCKYRLFDVHTVRFSAITSAQLFPSKIVINVNSNSNDSAICCEIFVSVGVKRSYKSIIVDGSLYFRLYKCEFFNFIEFSGCSVRFLFKVAFKNLKKKNNLTPHIRQ